jgi:hypothetical protein
MARLERRKRLFCKDKMSDQSTSLDHWPQVRFLHMNVDLPGLDGGIPGSGGTLDGRHPEVIDQAAAPSQRTDQRATLIAKGRLACAPLVEGRVSLAIEACASVSVDNTCRL